MNLTKNNLQDVLKQDNIKSLKNVDLSNKQIANLNERVFEELENIEQLHLNSNQMKSLNSQTFFGLANLKLLDLEANNLKTIDFSFKSLPNLVYIGLQKNEIEKIVENAFEGLSKLEILFLDENRLKELPPKLLNDLVNLTHIRISKNELNSICKDFFAKLEKLVILNLANNEIESLPDGCFKELNKLETLSLDKNKLNTISSKNLEGLVSLTAFSACSNEIATIDDDAFQHLLDLEEIHLSTNKITLITNKLFTKNSNLRTINIESNLVEIIENDAFKSLSKLKAIILYRNQIKHVEPKLFEGLVNLEVLNLSSNRIETINENLLRGLGNLKDIELDDNQITFLNRNHFQDLINVEKILLEYNKIRLISSQTFSSLKNCNKITLNNNLIETIETKAFWDLPSLEEIELSYNRIKYLRSEAFGDFTQMKHLTKLDISGSDQLEFIDLITLINLNKLDKTNVKILKKIKTKDVDFFPGGMNKVSETIIDSQIRISYEINFSKFFAIGLLLKCAIHVDKNAGTDDYKQFVQFYLRTFREEQQFDGFRKLFEWIGDEYREMAQEFIVSFLKQEIVLDIFHHTLMNGESEIFPIMTEFSLAFENDLLIGYLKRSEFKKFDKLINRFLTLSKEPIKSNAYFILLNCLFWTDDQYGTIFDYILDDDIKSEKYDRKNMLESLLNLRGLYFNSKTMSEYTKLTPHIKATLKSNDNDIFRTLIYSKNHNNCLIYSIASLGSNQLLSFLLKDKNQVKLLAKLSPSWTEMSPLEKILQHSEKISNNTVKQIIDKYLDLNTELRVPIRLTSESILNLARRNEAYLFRILMENTNVLNEKSFSQRKTFENFKIHLKNSMDPCLNIAMEQNNERIGEFLIDKIIELNINDFNKEIIEYDTLAKLFDMKWWTEIEKIFDSFCLPPMHTCELSQEGELEEEVVLIHENDQVSNVSETNQQSISPKLSSNSKFSNFTTRNQSKSLLELDYLLDDDINQKEESLPLKFPKNESEALSLTNEKFFNFICIESNKLLQDMFDEKKEHMLMMIAKSGRPKLIRHKLILRLVQKKWRFLPRIVYHVQTCMHFGFLVCFLFYTLDEFKIINQEKLSHQNESLTNTTSTFTQGLTSNYIALVITWLLLIYFLTYELFEASVEKFTYLFSLKNCLECITYTFGLVVLVIIQFDGSSQISSLLGSFVVLFGFIVLMLRMEKNSLFGSYVVAFRKSFTNTMKTLPFIILLFAGFVFSFKIRSNNGVTFLSNTKFLDSLNIAKMTNMIIGGYELGEMGLNETGLANEISNFFIYFIFLILMTIISVNLLTGIAIGELESVLKEAEIFNIQQRIAYCLRIQKIMNGIETRLKRIFKCLKKVQVLNKLMVFENDGNGKNGVRKNQSLIKKILKWFRRNSQPEIEFLESDEKDLGEYLNEAEYNSRVHQDYISTKMSENEYKLISISESIENQSVEHMRKINDIDLSVAKNEKQLAEVTERFVEMNKKILTWEESIDDRFVELNRKYSNLEEKLASFDKNLLQILDLISKK